MANGFPICISGVLCTKTNANIPKNTKKTRNRKRSNAIPNNNLNAYENRKG